MNLKWHFATTGSVEDDGFHDPLRETFEGDHERYVARETIQNAVDAHKGGEPVRVHFERLLLPAERLPGRAEFADILERANEYARGQERSDEFYDSALAMINSESVPVLKISDFNTTGLNGGDKDKDGEWYRLIRATGASSMSGVGGGSFGIGKGAPFAASALRTVFYSTINKDGESAFQGKSRISSFILDDDVKRGIGLFGNDGISSIRSANDIPDEFQRREQGTDIHIMGYLTEGDDWRRLLIQSVLSNFYAAIHFGDLIVSFSDQGQEPLEINSANLEEFLINYSSKEKDNALFFYKALIEGEAAITENLPILGECSLYVKKADGFPKMVQMMRKPKMVVKTTAPSAFRVLGEPFSAVFLCASEDGNKLLRLLEPPAHNEWDPNRHSDKKLGRKITKEVNDFIRDSLRSLAPDAGNSPEEIPELSYLLPENDESVDESSEAGEPFEGKPVGETGSETGARKEAASAKISAVIKRKAPIVKLGGPGGTKDAEPYNKEKNGGNSGGGGGNGAPVDPELPGSIPFIDTAEIQFRSREIRRGDEILYRAVITPANDDKGSLKLASVGEDASYPLEIASAVTEGGEKIDFEGDLLKNLELTKDQPLKIYITFSDSKRYAIGVKRNGSR